MADPQTTVIEDHRLPGWIAGAAVGGLLLSIAALAWALALQNKLTIAGKALDTANAQNAALADRIEDTNERLKAQGQALGQSMGITQKQLEDRSADLLASQKSAALATKQLAQQQAAVARQVGAVQTDVASVKTDVGGVKSDVATAQADLASTKTALTRVVGDQGVMSGLIATNRDQLDELRRMGQRTYYEFSLTKGQPAQNVGTIKLELKKADQKKSKFTLNVGSDDKTIEKKDKNVNEPIQFYSGKSPMLFEIVVNSVGRNTVSGYLSTPKNAPTPISVP